MSKSIIRIVALLLVPAIVADPVAAAAFHGICSEQTERQVDSFAPSKSLFTSEALAGRLMSVPLKRPGDFASRVDGIISMTHDQNKVSLVEAPTGVGANPRRLSDYFLDAQQLDTLEEDILREVEALPNFNAHYSPNDLEDYSTYVVSQAERLGIAVREHVPGVWKVNMLYLRTFPNKLWDAWQQLAKGSTEEFIRSAGYIVLSYPFLWLCQYHHPVASYGLDQQGNMAFQYMSRGRLFWSTWHLSLAGISLLCRHHYGVGLAAVGLQVVALLFRHLSALEGSKKGHELSHVLQFIFVERVRRALAVPEGFDAFWNRIPASVYESSVQSIVYSPPSPGQLREIIKSLFEAMRRNMPLKRQASPPPFAAPGQLQKPSVSTSGSA